METFFLFIFFIAFGILTWRNFQLALTGLVFLLPAYLIRFSIGPLPTTVLEGMILILFIAWLFKGNLLARMKVLAKSTFFWPGLLLLLGATLSILWASEAQAALGIWKAYFIEPFLVYLIILDTVKTKEAWKQIFIALGLTTILLFILATFQRITGWWSPTWEWTLPGSRRVTGLYTSPNALGLYVAPITALYVAWMYFKQNVPQQLQVFRVLVLLAGVGSLLFAVSRGAMIALLIAFFVLTFIRFSKKWTLAAAGLLLVAAFIAPMFRTTFIDFATFQLDSGQSRLALYEGTVELLKEDPLKGVGLASFAQRYEEVRPDQFTEKLIYPHNIFLNFWSETSLVGLIAIIWVMVLIAKRMFTHRQFDATWLFLAPLIVILVHGLVDVPYFKNDLAVLTWIFLAGLAAVAQNQKLEDFV